MNRIEFINLLEKRLNGLPNDVKVETIEFWNEIISDKIEDGASEEEVINELNIDVIVEDTLKEIPLKKLIKEKAKGKGWLAFVIATFYIWIALFAVLLALYACIWSVVVSFGAAAVGCEGFALLSVIKGIVDVFGIDISYGLLFIGMGIFAVGLGILLCVLTIKLAKLVCGLTKKIFLMTKLLFVRRGEANEG